MALPIPLQGADPEHDVLGLDNYTEVLISPNVGRSCINEASEGDAAPGLATGQSVASDASSVVGADIVVHCLPTLFTADGRPDHGAAQNTRHTFGANVMTRTVPVVQSTTYPHTTEDCLAPLVLGNKDPVRKDIPIAWSPQWTYPGHDLYSARRIPNAPRRPYSPMHMRYPAFLQELPRCRTQNQRYKGSRDGLATAKHLSPREHSAT